MRGFLLLDELCAAWICSPGVYTFVGGNQSDTASATNNNPSGGTITNSWKGGWTQSNGRISGIFRPVRA